METKKVVPVEPLTAAIARGWCHPMNSHKEMDPNLVLAIADEVTKWLAAALAQSQPAKETAAQQIADTVRSEVGAPPARTSVDATAPMLTDEQIDEWCRKIQNKIWDEFAAEPNEAHGKNLMARFAKLCAQAKLANRGGGEPTCGHGKRITDYCIGCGRVNGG